jgi:hypothetical protein
MAYLVCLPGDLVIPSTPAPNKLENRSDPTRQGFELAKPSSIP